MVISIQTNYIAKHQAPKENKPFNNHFFYINNLKTDTFEKRVSFAGLSKDLGKKLYNDETSIIKASEKNKYSNNVVGNMPPSWVNKIPFEERKESIQGLYSRLDKISNLLRECDFSKKSEVKAEKRLTLAYRKAGIISNDDSITMTKLGAGSSGYGYLIEGLPNNEKYVMKIYHQYDGYNRLAGQYIEMNRAKYWRKNAGSNNQRTEFFFGNIDSGYMFTRYIDENSAKPKRIINPLLLGIIPREDYGKNKIGNYYIDYGYLDKYGVIKINGKNIDLQEVLSENKDARFAFRRIFNSKNKEETWKELCESNKYKNKVGIKAGLAISLDFVDDQKDKYNYLYSIIPTVKNNEEQLLLKKALAQKIQYAPEEKFQECFLSFMNSGEKVARILRNKVYYTDNAEIESKIRKNLDWYNKTPA